MQPPLVHTHALAPDLATQRPVVGRPSVPRAITTTAAVTVSGTVTDSSGTPAYSIIVVYDSTTKVVATRAWTDQSGAYSLAVPVGTYDFYVRRFGWPPIVVRGIPISAPTSRDFIVDGTTVAGQLTTSGLSRLAVFADESDSSTLTMTASADLGDSIAVFNEFATFTVDGVVSGEIVLYDDGTHGDVTPHDRAYTRAGLGLRSDALYLCTIGGAPLLYALTPPGMMHTPPIYLVGVEPTYRASVAISGGAQYTARAANVVLESFAPTWIQEATQAFYSTFQDRYDFLALFREGPSDGATAIGISNDVLGIGLPVFDESGLYGSDGALQLLTLFSFAPEFPFLHELAHRWGNYLQPLIDPDDRFGYHWGYSSVNGVLGGFDAATLIANPDGTYTAPGIAPFGYASDHAFSPLERYLAGFAPSTSVGTITVFKNPHPEETTFATDERREVSVTDVQSQFGVRSPGYDQAQKLLRLAVVGVSTRPLSQAEMTFLDRVARNYDGSSSEINGTSGCGPYPFTFTWATGEGSLDTGIRTTAPGNVIATATTATSVAVSWEAVDGATGYRIYRTGSISQPFQLVGTASSTAFNDLEVSAGRTYLYAVTSLGSKGESPRSAPDFATTVVFTSDPLQAASSIVRASHLIEIRSAVGAMRTAAGLTPFQYSEAVTAGTTIRAQHVRELRTALDAARAAFDASALSYSDLAITAGHTPIKAQHWQELRDGSR